MHSEQYSVLTHWFKSEIGNVLENKFKPQIFHLLFSCRYIKQKTNLCLIRVFNLIMNLSFIWYVHLKLSYSAQKIQLRASLNPYMQFYVFIFILFKVEVKDFGYSNRQSAPLDTNSIKPVPAPKMLLHKHRGSSWPRGTLQIWLRSSGKWREWTLWLILTQNKQTNI